MTATVLQPTVTRTQGNHIATAFFERGCLINVGNRPNRTPVLFRNVTAALELYFGWQLPVQFLRARSWCGAAFNNGQMPAGFGADHSGLLNYNQPGTPPRHYSPLICMNMMRILPLEWGITGPRPVADFTYEINIQPAAAAAAFHARFGEGQYQASLTADVPYYLGIMGFSH